MNTYKDDVRRLLGKTRRLLDDLRQYRNDIDSYNENYNTGDAIEYGMPLEAMIASYEKLIEDLESRIR